MRFILSTRNEIVENHVILIITLNGEHVYSFSISVFKVDDISRISASIHIKMKTKRMYAHNDDIRTTAPNCIILFFFFIVRTKLV